MLTTDYLISENKRLGKELKDPATHYLRIEREIITLKDENRTLYNKYEKVSSKYKKISSEINSMKKQLKKWV